MTKFYKKYRYFATTECADWSSVAQQRPGAGAFSTAPAPQKKSGSTTLRRYWYLPSEPDLPGDGAKAEHYYHV